MPKEKDYNEKMEIEFENMNERLKKNKKVAGKVLTSVEKIGAYVDYMLPKIAIYFVTTYGLTFEVIQYELRKHKNALIQLYWILAKVRLNQYSK